MSDFDDPICTDCSRPFSEHDEFREAVAARTERKLAEHKHLMQVVEHKMSPDTAPKPRTETLDALELARIEKLAEVRTINHRADQIVETHHGIPVGAVPTHEERKAYFKDIEPDGIEYRNPFGTKE